MQLFNELIKSFDKIRSYLQDFAIYGYKTREDFTHKSSRTYDNERRRIQSYLGHYVDEQTSAEGKRLSIHFDSLNISANPFFETYKTKSFTKNDIMLHFIILDLFNRHDLLCVNDVTSFITDDYLIHFDSDKTPDARTIRMKLDEYAELDILSIYKEGKVVYYKRVPNLFDTLPETAKHHLLDAISYFQNAAPLGLLGHFILERENRQNNFFTFPDLHFTHVLDENIVLKLTEAIRARRQVFLCHTTTARTKVLPLKIVDNVGQGRRYVMVYQYSVNRYKFYRIDKLFNIVLLEDIDVSYNMKLSIINALLQNSWGVALNDIRSGAPLETWSLLLYIDEEKEKHILDELMAYTPTAILQRTAKNTFSYTFSLLEANEMTPWLRKLIGHILHVECTNEMIMNRFIRDVRSVYNYYKIAGEIADTEDSFCLQTASDEMSLEDNTIKNYAPKTLSERSAKEKVTKKNTAFSEIEPEYDLFHKLYSKYYKLAYSILIESSSKVISLKRIREIVSKQGFLESPTSFVPCMISQKDDGYGLLKETSPDTYHSVLKEIPSSYLTRLEKEWLASLINDPKINLFLNEEDLFYIKKHLSGVAPLYDTNTFGAVQQSKEHTPYEDFYYVNSFKQILYALEKNRAIQINEKQGSYIPYKLEYSLKKDVFTLLAITYQKSEMTSLVRIPLISIHSIHVLEAHHLQNKLSAFAENFKVKTPITFWLSNKRSGFDRVFMYLSNYERLTTFDETTHSCTVQLYYYPFDEANLIDTLISFGPILKVLSPLPVILKIKERVDTQKDLFANFFSE